MFKLIENLRSKSDRTKKQVAFSIAFFFSGIIFVFWLGIIYPDFRDSTNKEKMVASLEPSPVSVFGDTLSEGISSIQNQFSALKDGVTSFATNSTYYNATSTEEAARSATSTVEQVPR